MRRWSSAAHRGGGNFECEILNAEPRAESGPTRASLDAAERPVARGGALQNSGDNVQSPAALSNPEGSQPLAGGRAQRHHR